MHVYMESLEESQDKSGKLCRAGDATLMDAYLEWYPREVEVVARRAGTSRLAGAVNGIAVNKEELFKAACCNLGESFNTNLSVDVAYNDATTGARQIKLLGLSGTVGHLRVSNLLISCRRCSDSTRRRLLQELMLNIPIH